MKKSAKNFLFILLVTLGLVGNTFAQAPEGIIYQAEARDEKGNLIRNQTLDVLIKIIQDDATGQVVWEGLHEVTTSNFGIFVLIIGHGTNTSGYVFENIDWGNHPHFLNVQVKTTKGKKASAWIDMGTVQLLSVPYALHSKTAETVITETDPLFTAWDKSTGISITESQISDLDHFTNSDETDPLYSASQAVNITATNITNWNTAFNWGNHSGLYRPVSYVPAWSEIIGKPTFATVATSGSYNDLNNKPTIDGSETKVTAGTNVTITGVGTAASPYVINSTGGGSSHYIGESYGGGIVFWVDESGQHGKVCAKSDQSGGIRWYAGTYGITNAKSRGAGKVNTAIIIAAQVAIGDDGFNYAARICNELYIIEGEIDYYDWYLPSEMDLRLMYENKAIINATAIAKGGSAFADDFYWSSTEGDANYAGSKDFYINRWGNYDKSSTRCVRAVRAF